MVGKLTIFLIGLFALLTACGVISCASTPEPQEKRLGVTPVAVSSVPNGSAGDPDHQITTHCFYSHSNTGDPIADPSPDMAHLHDFFGNDSTDQDSTKQSLAAAGGNCFRETQKSAIWVPRITWGGEEVAPKRTGDYWGTRTGLDPERTTTTPDGFKMIAYAPAADNRSDGRPLANGAKARLNFHCNKAIGVQDSMDAPKTPPESCTERTLGIAVTFPECWDGEAWNVQGGANMRHSLYNPNTQNRFCPESHPRYIPRVQLFVDYDLPSAEGPLKVMGPGGMVMGPDFYHADYFNVEDPAVLGPLVEQCIRRGKSATEPACRH